MTHIPEEARNMILWILDVCKEAESGDQALKALGQIEQEVANFILRNRDAVESPESDETPRSEHCLDCRESLKNGHICGAVENDSRSLCETEGHVPIPGDPEGQCVRCPWKQGSCDKVCIPQDDGRQYSYTKAEIDERLNGVLAIIEDGLSALDDVSQVSHAENQIMEFRRRYLQK